MTVPADALTDQVRAVVDAAEAYRQACVRPGPLHWRQYLHILEARRVLFAALQAMENGHGQSQSAPPSLP